MNLKTLPDVNVKDKTILVRADYNGADKDDTRIRLTLPTLHYLLDRSCRIIIVSHNGRPDGRVVRSLRLRPIAKRLSQLLRHPVQTSAYCQGSAVTQAVASLKPREILLLENIRFCAGETDNDPALAKFLASLADIVVNDAFSASHRAHASVSGVARYKPMVAGLHLEKEVKMLSHLLKNPKKPFVVIIGGAKVSDKVAVVEHLGQKADVVLVGGGVANNFLAADGKPVFKSFLEDIIVDKTKRRINFVNLAHKLLSTNHGKIVYPIDAVAALSPQHSSITRVNLINPLSYAKLNPKLMYLDIGPNTIKLYREIILQAETIFWNGPMGVFEKRPFAAGTRQIAAAIAKSQALSVLGGGDTLTAIHQFGFQDRYDYVSAAGGAALEFLAGKSLPGLTPMIVK
jgi:3-phosphoglycerate kinase